MLKPLYAHHIKFLGKIFRDEANANAQQDCIRVHVSADCNVHIVHVHRHDVYILVIIHGVWHIRYSIYVAKYRAMLLYK